MDDYGKYGVLELDSGQKLYEIMCRPLGNVEISRGDRIAIHEFIKAIDPDLTGKIQTSIDDWIELTPTLHDILLRKLDIKDIRWFGNIEHPTLFVVEESFRNATDVKPALDLNTNHTTPNLALVTD